jgi:hypothetical protein
MSVVIITLSLYAFMARELNTVVVEKYNVMIGLVWFIVAHFIVLSSKISFNIFKFLKRLLRHKSS